MMGMMHKGGGKNWGEMQPSGWRTLLPGMCWNVIENQTVHGGSVYSQTPARRQPWGPVSRFPSLLAARKSVPYGPKTMGYVHVDHTGAEGGCW